MPIPPLSSASQWTPGKWYTPEPIKNWIQFIPGYMQNRAETNLGLPAMTHEFYDLYDRTDRAKVEFEEWNSDFDMQAEWVRRLSFGCAPKIMVVAYSWGVGYGAMRFCNALRDRGLEVDHLVITDGVYHLGGKICHQLGWSQVAAYYPYSPCTQKVLNKWKYLPQRPKIRVPDNVKAIDWFVQSNSRCLDRLRGHEVVWDATGEPCPGRKDIVYRIHSSMDECPEFWEKCREVAHNLFPVPAQGV